MGLRISQLLDPSRVVLDLPATRRVQAIKEVAQRLEGLPQITSFAGFYSELLVRERLDTTCIGHGVALPHARTDHASGIVMAAGRCQAGVNFEKPDQIVRLIFVLATPKALVREYLEVVGALCRLLKDPAVRTALLEAPSSEAFIDRMAAAEAEQIGAA